MHFYPKLFKNFFLRLSLAVLWWPRLPSATYNSPCSKYVLDIQVKERHDTMNKERMRDETRERGYTLYHTCGEVLLYLMGRRGRQSVVFRLSVSMYVGKSGFGGCRSYIYIDIHLYILMRIVITLHRWCDALCEYVTRCVCVCAHEPRGHWTQSMTCAHI